MTEFRAFLAWQWREICTAHWSTWTYFLGMIMMVAGFAMDTATAPRYFGVSLDILLIVAGGLAVLSYIGSFAFAFQLSRYRRERERVIESLGKEQR